MRRRRRRAAAIRSFEMIVEGLERRSRHGLARLLCHGGSFYGKKKAAVKAASV
jgi:endonuclease IV